uniref:Uncharacterized protein n=1 Tax=Anguilla anguilla TaxID=7936 RepID=A0A0E9RT39_ANGAN
MIPTVNVSADAVIPTVNVSADAVIPTVNVSAERCDSHSECQC